MLGWLALLFAMLAGLFAVIHNQAGGFDQISNLPIAAAVIITLFVLYAATFGGRLSASGRGSRLVLMAAAVIVVAAAGYAASRLPALQALIPFGQQADPDQTAASVSGPVSIRIRKASDGRFVARSEINGNAMDCVIDSGATTVMLRASDAEKAGFDIKALTFNTPIETANGTGYAATVQLRSIEIGTLKIDNIEALVAKPGSLNESLLGMNFLRRLASYEVTGDFVTLRQ